jgi:hypothetical protein
MRNSSRRFSNRAMTHSPALWRDPGARLLCQKVRLTVRALSVHQGPPADVGTLAKSVAGSSPPATRGADRVIGTGDE